MDNSQLICPNCGQAIEIASAVIESLKLQYQQAEQQKQSQEIEKIKQQFKEASEREHVDLQQRLRHEIGDEQAEKAKQLELERANNQKLRQKVDELLEKLNASMEAQNNADSKLKEELLGAKEEARQTAQKEISEKYQLQIEQSNKKIADLQKQAEEMQLKATQASGQLKGEVLELSLENSLSNEFPHDLIEEVAKGVRGADIRQTVRTAQGVMCGVILWESKNTKHWKNDWLQKLKDDTSAAKAHIPAIVSTVLPEESASGIAFIQGVWVAKPASALVLARLLRLRLLEISQAFIRHERRETNAEILYNYVTGHEFVQQVSSILSIFSEMKAGIDNERKALEKAWSKREAEINKLFQNTAAIVGSMEGAIGSDSMPKIEELSLKTMIENKKS